MAVSGAITEAIYSLNDLSDRFNLRQTDKLLARKRSIIETIIDQLKNISQIEHGC